MHEYQYLGKMRCFQRDVRARSEDEVFVHSQDCAEDEVAVNVPDAVTIVVLHDYDVFIDHSITRADYFPDRAIEGFSD
ncbi:hypothetical protein EOM86_11650 [Candidatus Nomurabacteria bacterium]|nr:hypothetical protein [Candidatus Nomurabacteria bacterium]